MEIQMNHKSKHDYNSRDFGSVSTFIDYLNSNLSQRQINHKAD
jgi:hypothetical protein